MTAACPTPKKRVYASQRAAIRAAIGSSKTFAHGTRTYRCPAGHWHVTTQTK